MTWQMNFCGAQEGSLSLTFVMFGSRLGYTLAMGRAPGVVTTGVRLMGDLCYCSLAVVLLWTALGYGPSGPAGGGQGQRETSGLRGTFQPSRVAGRVPSQEDPS
jgi:hypothetical protein